MKEKVIQYSKFVNQDYTGSQEDWEFLGAFLGLFEEGQFETWKADHPTFTQQCMAYYAAIQKFDSWNKKKKKIVK